MPYWNTPALKLVSDGTAEGTRLLLADGTSIPCIKKIGVSAISHDGLVDVVVSFVGVDMDIELDCSPADDFDKPSK